jgi:prophage antirepressor-like protein
MSPIVKYRCEALAGVVVNCIMDGDDPWFKAIDIATALKYTDTDQAIRLHVSDDDKRTQGSLIFNPVKSTGLKGNWKNTKYINESGLYCLIFGSEMEEAKIFKHWVTREVLPSIRKTGSYALPPPAQPTLIAKQIRLLNETDLHHKVVDLIKNSFPELTLVPGLGELQDTSSKRIDAYKKGYVGGQADIMILNPTTKYNGFAIELKTPKGNGRVSDNQHAYLDSLKDLRYKTLISCDYDEIVVELTRYYDDLRFPCPHCSKTFKTTRTRSGHITIFH